MRREGINPFKGVKVQRGGGKGNGSRISNKAMCGGPDADRRVAKV